MSQRKLGWYWVQLHGGLWVAVEWVGSEYGWAGEWHDDDFMEIGKRIPSPDETINAPTS